MAPRNNEGETNFKKINCPDDEADIKNAIPYMLHKKHKVVKLVKSQLLKIQQEGLLNTPESSGVYLDEEMMARMGEMPGTSKGLRASRTSEMSGDVRSSRTLSGDESPRSTCLVCYLVAFFIATLLLIFLIVWISIGPLSNSLPHTPIPTTSFVRHDSICSLEKKYLLRWGKPEYFE
ncbi:hypothetical protein RUM43_008633 [Polyplax serrata]|uniref:Uncharacterized protein n=1 Tax=Polyplax serrata TaxID=468196 RepID=A0AAN8S3Z6_POLSC